MLLTPVLLGLAGLATADTIPLKQPPKHLALIPVPIVYYTPETRLAYGAAATATVRFRRDDGFAAARPSQLTLAVAYTQNRQLLLYLPFQIFYDQARYYASGEAGYYRYNYYFYGAGQREVPRELYGVNFPRLRVNAFRRVGAGQGPGKLYAGLRYQYEDYRVSSTAAGGLLAGGTVPGGLGSRLSGGGLGLFYDSRDNVFFPRRGVVADLSFFLRNRAVGAGLAGETTRFDRYVADVSQYHALSPHAVLAVNYLASFIVGTAPFNALSLLGG